MADDPEKDDITRRIHLAQGELNYHLEKFGDQVAERESYNRDLTGIEALRFYLAHKFGWLPRDAKALSPEDIRWMLQEEIEGERSKRKPLPRAR